LNYFFKLLALKGRAFVPEWEEPHSCFILDQEFTAPLRRVLSLLTAVVVELAAGVRPLSEFEFANGNIYYGAGTPPRERLALPVGELLPAGLHGNMFSLGRHSGLYNREIFVSKKSIFELVTLIRA